MNKMKEYALITVAALAFMLITGVAKSDVTTTPKEFVTAITEVPGKVANHIQMEIEKTKQYQADSWAEMKFKFKGFKEKFIKTGNQ